MDSVKKIMMVGVVLAALGLLSACGTIHGFGKDVSRVGNDIQRSTH